MHMQPSCTFKPNLMYDQNFKYTFKECIYQNFKDPCLVLHSRINTVQLIESFPCSQWQSHWIWPMALSKREWSPLLHFTRALHSAHCWWSPQNLQLMSPSSCNSPTLQNPEHDEAWAGDIMRWKMKRQSSLSSFSLHPSWTTEMPKATDTPYCQTHLLTCIWFAFRITG